MKLFSYTDAIFSTKMFTHKEFATKINSCLAPKENSYKNEIHMQKTNLHEKHKLEQHNYHRVLYLCRDFS